MKLRELLAEMLDDKPTRFTFHGKGKAPVTPKKTPIHGADKKAGKTKGTTSHTGAGSDVGKHATKIKKGTMSLAHKGKEIF